MLIESIALEAVGCFRERVRLGPFHAGLNVLAQRNEWGKSTVLKALGHAFFDRYSSAVAHIQNLQSIGASLAPEVEVVFQAGGERWRAVKRFLAKRSCELHRWENGAWIRTDESDTADRRLRELVGAPPLEGRSMRPETWGFLRYLWARQDEPAQWPDWDEASGEATRRTLATVAIDEVMRAFKKRVDQKADLLMSQRGSRRGGPLHLAEEEHDRLTAEVAALTQRRKSLEEFEVRHGTLREELPRLEREFAEKKGDAEAARLAASAAEKSREAISHLQTELERRDSELQRARVDLETEKQLVISSHDWEQQSLLIASELRETDLHIQKLSDRLASAEADARSLLTARFEAGRSLDDARAAIRRLHKTRELTAVQAKHEAAVAIAQRLAEVEQSAGRLPKITESQLKQWKKLERSIQEGRIRLESFGFRVTLDSKEAGAVALEPGGAVDLEPGTPHTFRAHRALWMQLGAWGSVSIQSSIPEALEIEKTVATNEAEMTRSLAEARVASVAEAESVLQQLRDLSRDADRTRNELQTCLGGFPSLAALAGSLESLRREIGEHSRSEAEPDALFDWEAKEAALQEHQRSLELQHAGRERDVGTARSELETARLKREQLRSKASTAEASRTALHEQQLQLAARLPGGAAAAFKAAQEEFVRAEARLAEARRQLPAESALLPERHLRANRAAAEVERLLEEKRAEMQRVEAILIDRGGDGLHARQAELEYRLSVAAAARSNLREEARALRLVSFLIERHEQRAIQTVLSPLEDRLSAAFAQITGKQDRRVWLDERLRVEGVGSRKDELTRFDDLSRGAREQLLLALRAAIALELANDEPQCLILDDVLVHTDSARHQNVLDYLQELAGRLQVIVLTCHEERYRGIGAAVPVSDGDC